MQKRDEGGRLRACTRQRGRPPARPEAPHTRPAQPGPATSAAVPRRARRRRPIPQTIPTRRSGIHGAAATCCHERSRRRQGGKREPHNDPVRRRARQLHGHKLRAAARPLRAGALSGARGSGTGLCVALVGGGHGGVGLPLLAQLPDGAFSLSLHPDPLLSHCPTTAHHKHLTGETATGSQNKRLAPRTGRSLSCSPSLPPSLPPPLSPSPSPSLSLSLSFSLFPPSFSPSENLYFRSYLHPALFSQLYSGGW